MNAPVFYYDFSSPYAYLAACRIDELLGDGLQWRPIAFGVIVKRTGKVPWSFAADRTADLEAIEQRAAMRGLPPIRYPDGWPAQTYSLTPLRAAVLAEDQGLLRELSGELFRIQFAEGRPLGDEDVVIDAAERVGMDPERARAGLGSPEVKERLRAATDAALARGVTGVPTVAVGERLFWGDDRLEEAAALRQ